MVHAERGPTGTSPRPDAAAPALARELGTADAVLLGLGAMVGSGVFVALGLSIAPAGGFGLVAIALAAALAALNASSSARLAAAHPTSGGTYEYGHRLLHPLLGFAAGWSFLCAKTASAAVAALGFATHAGRALGLDPRFDGPLAALVGLSLTALVAGGLRRTARANLVLVAATLLALVTLVVAAAPRALSARAVPLDWSRPDLLPAATALVFVAFTGYGRLATLGEEVREPERTIPRAIAVTTALVAVLYLVVGGVALRAAGASVLLERGAEHAGAPLVAVAHAVDAPLAAAVVGLGALVATLGVLLNLVLGLSRVVLAMARRGELPPALAHVDRRGPGRAVVAVGLVVSALAASGALAASWSVSAAAVLVYYAITNLAALALVRRERLGPARAAPAALGLVGCLALVPAVEASALLSVGAAAAVGALVLALSRRWRRHPESNRG